MTEAALLKRQQREIEELRRKLQGNNSEIMEEEIAKMRNAMLAVSSRSLLTRSRLNTLAKHLEHGTEAVVICSEGSFPDSLKYNAGLEPHIAAVEVLVTALCSSDLRLGCRSSSRRSVWRLSLRSGEPRISGAGRRRRRGSTSSRRRSTR